MSWDLETVDLGLRPLDEEDATDTLIAWLNDPDITRFMQAGHKPQNEDRVIAYIQSCAEDQATVLMGVFDKVSGDMIGTAKLSGIDGHHRTAKLGFMIGDADYHGQGLGTQLVAIMAEVGMVDLGLRKITATVHEPNVAAMRCLEKNEFREEGFLRDQFLVDDEPVGATVFGKLRDDW